MVDSTPTGAAHHVGRCGVIFELWSGGVTIDTSDCVFTNEEDCSRRDSGGFEIDNNVLVQLNMAINWGFSI